MSDRAPYSRVYWSVKSDSKFVGIYSDDHHMATWLRLLLAADATWPTPADVPATARRASVKALVEAQLVDLLEGGMFSIHGLDAERGRRRDAARDSANARPSGTRTPTERPPNGQRPVPGRSASRDELSRDELSRDEDNARDAASVLYQRTGEFPGPKIVSWLNELSEAHGERRLAYAIAGEPMNGRKLPDYLRTVRDLLRSEDHAAERAEAEDEKRRNEEKRRPVVLRQPVEDISDEEAERLAAEYLATQSRPA